MYAMLVGKVSCKSVNPYGHTAEWWSLGILRYAMLVGKVSHKYVYPYGHTADWYEVFLCRNIS